MYIFLAVARINYDMKQNKMRCEQYNKWISIASYIFNTMQYHAVINWEVILSYRHVPLIKPNTENL